VDSITVQQWRYFFFGLLLGALVGSFVVSLGTQYVEHGDALYPARIHLSRKGRSVNFELLQQ
jgi:uncharacterized membrane-anchored protein YhcB (DUF1043 family)